MSSPASGRPAGDGGLVRYAIGVTITVVAVLSQYFVPQQVPAARVVYYHLLGDLFVVYGIPIVAFLGLVGLGPLRRWRANLGIAAWEGLGWFGVLSLLALALVLLLAIVYALIDPSLLALLGRTNPALAQADSDPWLFVGLSFLVGAIEETIFRGWIFGFWQHRPGSWLVPATWTSAVFAGVHLYYGTTYGLASPLIFPSLFFAGFAFAAAYRFSGGNLVVPALLHGQMDATAYLSLVSPGAALVAHYAVIVAAAIVGLVGYARAGPGVPERGPVGPILRLLDVVPAVPQNAPPGAP